MFRGCKTAVRRLVRLSAGLSGLAFLWCPAGHAADAGPNTGSTPHQPGSTAPNPAAETAWYSRFSIGAGGFVSRSPYKGVHYETRVIPVVTYFGERLVVTGPSASYHLRRALGWRVKALGRVRFRSYEEDDSPILAGMGDRRETFEAGLGLERRIQRIDLSLEALGDTLGRHRGQYADIRISRAFRFNDWRLTPSASVVWQNAKMSNYYYGVEPEQATEERPAYATGHTVSGRLGAMIQMSAFDPVMATLGAGLEFPGSRITDSPLVDQGPYASAFASLTYRF